MDQWTQSGIATIIAALWFRLVWIQNRRDKESRSEIDSLRAQVSAVEQDVQKLREELGELHTLAFAVAECQVAGCPHKTLARMCLRKNEFC